eukprot:PhM_4_TR18074/c1_g1_i4/m.44653
MHATAFVLLMCILTAVNAQTYNNYAIPDVLANDDCNKLDPPVLNGFCNCTGVGQYCNDGLGSTVLDQCVLGRHNTFFCAGQSKALARTPTPLTDADAFNVRENGHIHNGVLYFLRSDASGLGTNRAVNQTIYKMNMTTRVIDRYIDTAADAGVGGSTVDFVTVDNATGEVFFVAGHHTVFKVASRTSDTSFTLDKVCHVHDTTRISGIVVGTTYVFLSHAAIHMLTRCSKTATNGVDPNIWLGSPHKYDPNIYDPGTYPPSFVQFYTLDVNLTGMATIHPKELTVLGDRVVWIDRMPNYLHPYFKSRERIRVVSAQQEYDGAVSMTGAILYYAADDVARSQNMRSGSNACLASRSEFTTLGPLMTYKGTLTSTAYPCLIEDGSSYWADGLKATVNYASLNAPIYIAKQTWEVSYRPPVHHGATLSFGSIVFDDEVMFYVEHGHGVFMASGITNSTPSVYLVTSSGITSATRVTLIAATHNDTHGAVVLAKSNQMHIVEFRFCNTNFLVQPRMSVQFNGTRIPEGTRNRVWCAGELEPQWSVCLSTGQWSPVKCNTTATASSTLTETATSAGVDIVRVDGCSPLGDATIGCNPSNLSNVNLTVTLRPLGALNESTVSLTVGNLVCITTNVSLLSDGNIAYNCAGLSGNTPTTARAYRIKVTAPTQTEKPRVFARFAPAPYVSSVRCDTDFGAAFANPATDNCPIPTYLRVEGGNFFADGVTVPTVGGAVVAYDAAISTDNIMYMYVNTERTVAGHEVRVAVGEQQSASLTYNNKQRPIVTSVSGCTAQGTATVNCGTSSTITISGTFQNSVSPSVAVGDSFCQATQVSSTTITCTVLPSAGGLVRVTQDSLSSNANDAVYVSMTKQCVSNAAGVCAGRGLCVDGQCACYQNATGGYWALDGSGLCTTCATGYAGASCLSPCSCVGGTCDIRTGRCSSCNTGFAGENCTLVCPRANNTFCGGHGTCSDGISGTGLCTCVAPWIGSACATCNNVHYGQQCQNICPGTTGTQPCNGHGTCDSGTMGSGNCTCNGGYAGTACTDLCPTNSGLVCGGHGTCSAGTCVCQSSSAGGYWSLNAATQTCSVCDLEHSNDTAGGCRAACPGYTGSAVCSGHGACQAGVCTCSSSEYCGTACSDVGSVCSANACVPSYYYGSTCNLVCPGLTASNAPCNGHGTCSSGKTGTGLCTCTSDLAGGLYVGSACNVSCAHCGSGISCDMTGKCECPAGTAGPSCTACPGTPACSGNGACVVAADNVNVQCQCHTGYIGTSCESRCPDAFGGSNPCSGHGTCSLTGCTCDSSSTRGFWRGALCSECQTPYGGTNCDATCPGYDATAGTHCHGHGTCNMATLQCACETSTAKGHWALAPISSGLYSCTQCAPGYYGAKCVTECPGGACAPCSGHGTCSAGVTGTGNCTCSGNFADAACSQCRSGYYGSVCGLRCPIALGSVCGSHGTCSDGLTGTGMCTCHTGYQGTTCTSCLTGYELVGTACAACPTGMNGLPCSGRGSCVSSKCTCPETHVGVACSLPCPTNSAGSVCSGVAQCIAGSSSAKCSCPTQYSGDACASCKAGFTGPTCSQTCPGGSTTPCSLRGVCNRNATCTCRVGYWGADCGKTCPGGVSNTCGGHGTCVEINNVVSCQCDASASTGYWQLNGTLCSSCLRTSAQQYESEATGCMNRCPTNNGQICNGKGTCTAFGTCRCNSGSTFADTVCGPACELSGTSCVNIACPEPYWGVNCDQLCPGSGSNNVACSGHGVCENSKVSTGTCSCGASYVGTGCNVQCAPCDATGGTCSSDAQTLGHCICRAGYGGASCAVQCPVIGGEVCGGSTRGRCLTSTGTCSCVAGYVGATCQLKCPGPSGVPCGNHGTCTEQSGAAICTCHNTTADGFWTDSACSSCVEPYSLPHCNATCPGRVGGTSCSGHGACEVMTGNVLQCVCTANSAQGYWTGTQCDQCAPGYYGSGCSQACPGGACQPCAGHGTCGSGRLGTGLCICSQSVSGGLWTGYECNDCMVGYYGASCTSQCPGGAANACNGHGTCSSGPTGTGLCTCTSGWRTPSCDDCASGYYGAGCSSECPKYNGLPCGGSSRGQCSDTLVGTGLCTCNVGYSGDNCAISCPTYEGRVCNGRGSCVHQFGEGACVCVASSSQGHWSGALCTLCSAGYYGTNCDLECPGGALSPCNGHGVSNGCTRDGLCECAVGWVGPACATPCAKGPNGLTCSGHGTCQSDGSCTCHNSAQLGYWEPSSNCSSCVAGVVAVSNNCTSRCPGTAVSGGVTSVCLGRGVCVASISSSPSTSSNATCIQCTAGYCGNACDLGGPLNPAACDSETCPPGQYGPKRTDRTDGSCSFNCPGLVGTVACSGHGNCSEGVRGSGACFCASTHTGSDCSIACQPCSSHGQCSATDGSCACLSGWSGATCEAECPGGATSPCGRSTLAPHGTCSDGNTGTGECMCFAGWGGPSCLMECPGSTRTAQDGAATSVCSSHGICVPQPTPTCQCLSNWAGNASCNECTAGMYGTMCELPCPSNRGTSQSGGRCQCHCNSTACYFGTSCSSACPTGADGLVCSNHGTCDSGVGGTGACVCSPNYYGPTCAVRCVASECSGNSNNVQCDAATGKCACKQSYADGYWAGSTCDSCAANYYGSSCSLVCNCNQRGTCDRVSGICSCYQDAVNGYWTDSTCSSCLAGYIGEQCLVRSVSVTLSGSIAPPVLPSVYNQRDKANSFTLIDDKYKHTFVGARPLLVLQPDGAAMVQHPSSSIFLQLANTGSIWSGTLHNTTVEFLFVRDDGGVQYLTFDRATVTATATTASATSVLHHDDGVAHDGFLLASEQHTLEHHTGTRRRLLQTQQSAFATTVQKLDWVAPDGTRYTAVLSGTSGSYTVRFLTPTAGRSRQPITINLKTATSLDINYVGDVAVSGANSNNFWDVHVAFTNGTVKSLANHVQMPLCLSGTRPICPSALRVSLFNDTAYVVAQRDSGLVLGRIHMNHGTSNAIEVVNTVIGDSHGGACTAMTMDALSGTGYVAFNTFAAGGSANPSTILSFNMTTSTILGSVNLEVFNGEAEVAASMVADESVRIMRTTPSTSQPRIIEANMFAVKSIFPDVMNSFGTGLVTVYGQGFQELVGHVGYCRFTLSTGAKYNVPIARYAADGTFVVCQLLPDDGTTPGNATLAANATNTSAVSESVSKCDGLPVEVSLHSGDRVTNNLFTLRRQAPPTIVHVSPKQGVFNLPQRITVTGTGFLETPSAGCRVMDLFPNLGRPSVFGRAVNVSTNRMVCDMSYATFLGTMHPGHTHVYATLDGFAFSNGLPFNVTGPPFGIATAYDTITVTYANSPDLTLPSQILYIVDDRGQELDSPNSFPCYFCTRNFSFRVRITGAKINATDNDRGLGLGYRPSFTPNSKTEENVTRGFMILSNLTLVAPPAGRYAIEYTETVSGWTWHQSVNVIAGEPHAVRFVVSSLPLETDGNYGIVMSPAPKVRVVDVGTNYLTKPDLVAVTLTVEEALNPRASAPDWTDKILASYDESGVYDFTPTGVLVIAKFLTQYRFVARGEWESAFPVKLVEHAAPTTFTAGPCRGDGSFVQLPLQTVCSVCPANAVCSNTAVLIPERNYWRANNVSLTLYKCHPEKLFCEGETQTGKCREGHTGVLCRTCIEDYGMTGDVCVECPSKAESAFILLAVALVFLILCLVIVRNAIYSQGRDVVLVIAKLMLNHVQLTSQMGNFGNELPQLLSGTYKAAETVSTPDSRFAAVSCSADHNRLHEFAFYVALPALIPVLAIVYEAILRLVDRRTASVEDQKRQRLLEYRNTIAALNYARRANDPMHVDIVGDIDVVKRSGLFQKRAVRSRRGRIIAAIIVLLNVFYITLVNQCAQVLRCVPIEESSIDPNTGAITTTTHRYLEEDYGVECSGSEYWRYGAAGIVFTVIYGLGIPVSAIIAYSFLCKRLGAEEANSLFLFMVSGNRARYWFWESVVMLRKTVLVYIVVFSNSGELQTYMAMWWIMLNLGVHVVLQPYMPSYLTGNVVNRLEALSLSMLAVHLNLSLLYAYNDAPEDDSPAWYYQALTVILFVIFVLVLLRFLQHLFREVRAHLRLGGIDDDDEGAGELDDVDEPWDESGVIAQRRVSHASGAMTPTTQSRRSGPMSPATKTE